MNDDSREFNIIVGNDDVTPEEIREVLNHMSMDVIEVTEVTDESDLEIKHEIENDRAQMVHDEMINSAYLENPSWGDQ